MSDHGRVTVLADRVHVAARGDGIAVLVEELHELRRAAHLVEVGEDAVRGGAIHLADGEARVHHHEVAHGRIRDVGEADRLRGPAETHLSHGQRAGVCARVDAHNLTGNPQAHASGSAPALQAPGGHGRLTRR